MFESWKTGSQGSAGLSRNRYLLAVCGTLALAALAALTAVSIVAPTAGAQEDPGGEPTDQGVDPVFVESPDKGTVDCAFLNASTDPKFGTITSDFGFKVEGSSNGTYPLDGSNGGALTGDAPEDPANWVKIENSDGTFFDWAASLGIDAVIVKGGTDADAYVYSPEDLADGGLHAPVNDPGPPIRYFGISHIEFCYDYERFVPLTASKTADGSYDRTVTWKLEKSVNPTSHTGTAGQDAGSSNWTVVATKSETKGNYQVKGSITIKNSNNIPVNVNVSDELDVGTVADVDCDPGTTGNQSSGTVPAATALGDGQLVCTYTAKPTDGTAKLNTAKITSTTDGVGGATATAPVSFKENLIGDDSVTLGDERFTYSKPISGTTTEVFPEKFPCPSDPSKYTNGVNERTETNTATLTGANTKLEAKADVGIKCTLPALEAKKDAAGTFDRKIDWKLDKTADPTSFNGEAGDTFTPQDLWTVDATKNVTEDNYKVTGKITITNPAAIPQSFDVSDALDDNTVATVDCDENTAGNQTTGTIPAGGNVTCSYTASPGDGSATKNTATVKADGNADQTATANVSFTPKVTGDEKVTLGDERFSYSELIDDTTDPPVQFDDKFDCSSNPSDYVDGKYSFKVTNVATLKGGSTNLSDDAEVTVNCTLPALTARKDAAGTFDRKIDWELTKSVDPSSHSGQQGQIAGSSDWTVHATKNVTEDNYKVTGKITIANPAAISQSFDVSDALDDGTIADVDCDEDTADNQTTGMIPAGGSVTCSYTASPANGEAEVNTATVKATGNADQTATADVSFTPKVTGDEEVTLADPRFTHSEKISGTTTEVFPETFRCPTAEQVQYVNGKYEFTATNTATLTGDNTNLSKSAEVTVTCWSTGARTMGFWQNKNGQDIIKNFCGGTSGTKLFAYLTGFNPGPFKDLTKYACKDIAAYVTNVIKAANASGAAMNAQLKGQMLATALDVYFSDPTLGGNKINASVVIGNVTIDLDNVCKNIPTCSILEDVGAAFNNESSMKVKDMLVHAAGQSNFNGTSWYGQVKATQQLAKDAFDAINNDVAFFSP